MIKEKKQNWDDIQKSKMAQSKQHKKKKHKIKEEYDEYEVEVLNGTRWVGYDEY